jgi:hypothetical protein
MITVNFYLIVGWKVLLTKYSLPSMQFFMEDCLQNLLDIIEREEETELPKLTLQERIVRLVRLRLEMQIPYVSQWAQALSVQVNCQTFLRF